MRCSLLTACFFLLLASGLNRAAAKNTDFYSNLPIVVIESNESINADKKVSASMKIINRGKGQRNTTTDTKFDYNGFIGIKWRGNSSLSFDQKQYTLETRSRAGKEVDAAFLGMPADNDWVLHAPYNDISLMRNALAYELWSDMDHWAPRTRMVELVLNNAYQGVYVLTETIKRGKDRVDIAKLDSNDVSGLSLTGGYIMRIDASNDVEDLTFTSSVKGLKSGMGSMPGFGGAPVAAAGIPAGGGFGGFGGFGNFGSAPAEGFGNFGGAPTGGPAAFGGFGGFGGFGAAPAGGPGGELGGNGGIGGIGGFGGFGGFGGGTGGFGGFGGGFMGADSTVIWMYFYPKADKLKAEQQGYIKRYIDTVEQVIQSKNFNDKKTGYARYIDVPSFVDYFIHTELSLNADGFKRSAYFYKDKVKPDGTGGKLVAGPVWDFNLAFGNCNFCNAANVEAWVYEGCETNPTPVIWKRLIQDPAFLDAVKRRYTALRKTVLSEKQLFNYIDTQASLLDEAKDRHFNTWNDLLKTTTASSTFMAMDKLSFNAYRVSSYAEEIQTLKKWLSARLAFLDKHFL